MSEIRTRQAFGHAVGVTTIGIVEPFCAPSFMGDVGVIDRFLEVFASYIDSGFGFLGGDVAFLATTLIAIDITLAAFFWAWGADDDILARLVKKTLGVGVFPYVIGNWNDLARIVFDSFAGLGLIATGGTIAADELLQPGRIAQVGLEAVRSDPAGDPAAGLRHPPRDPRRLVVRGAGAATRARPHPPAAAADHRCRCCHAGGGRVVRRDRFFGLWTAAFLKSTAATSLPRCASAIPAT